MDETTTNLPACGHCFRVAQVPENEETAVGVLVLWEENMK